MRLILASGSPRRRELLTLLGISFEVAATDAEERDDPVPPEVVSALPPCPLALQAHPTLRAWRKAQAVWEIGNADVVLAADTEVVLDGTVLGKPQDAAHAEKMLTLLAGRAHTVYTGVCVVTRTGRMETGAVRMITRPSNQDGYCWLDLVTSSVLFAPLHPDEIAAYVATGEPLDKAGAYGIQGKGGQLVREVAGSYTSVVGLPLQETWRLLTAAGLSGLTDPTIAYHHWLHTQGKEPLPCPPTFP